MNERIAAIEHLKMPTLKLLVCVTDRRAHGQLETILAEHHAHSQHIIHAVGTAGSELVKLLGLGDQEKIITLCLEPDFRARPLLKEIALRLSFDKPNTGIAFTLSLTGISGAMATAFSREMRELQERMVSKMENEVMEKQKSAGHSLVVAVINHGYSDALISAARAEGISGGTTIHARRGGMEGAASFFGITIQPEREIVFILAPREKKRGIMQAISQQFGLRSEAQGMVLSIPVEDIEGLGEAR